MIRKQDILDRAAAWNLRPDIVEKDYVLGWVLAAFALHSAASQGWIFKGGTCLKKCFFETYRFSEDLDFSLLPDVPYGEAELRGVLLEVARLASELSGIEMPAEHISLHPRRDKQGHPTFQGRLAYHGPLLTRNWPKLTFDITAHEPVLTAPTPRPIGHAYPDPLPPSAQVVCYSLEELFAEKARALFERTRPRDLYDIVTLWNNARELLRLAEVHKLFARKCHVKGREPPSTTELVVLVRGSAELRTEWSNMLAHQLPQLPPLDALLDTLPTVLAWLDGSVPSSASLPTLPFEKEDVPLPASHGIQYWGQAMPLEMVRFAGVNRLVLSFVYREKKRQVEPYSLRRSSQGKLLLYAWDLADDHIKAFEVPLLQQVRTTSISFTPKYRIEFS